MTLNNINSMRKDRGFTIVELLIVIVVIAILAAITIVAYNGIQNRAKASSGQALANSVAKKAEAYQAARTTGSGYPTHAELTATTSAVTEAQLDQPSAVLSAAPDASTANGGKAVGYVGQAAAGACVAWWDYAAATPGLKYIAVGSGDAGALC